MEKPDQGEIQLLMNLLSTSVLSEDQREAVAPIIKQCDNYKDYAQLQYELEVFQPTYDEIPNPSLTDINKHLKRFV